MKRIEVLLGRLIGLDVESFGVEAVRDVIRNRMSATGITDPAAYESLMDTSPAERSALVESIVVSETWFFREPASFDFLRELVGGKITRYLQRPVRILSIPCATGEEPYSVAMTLLGLGLSPASILVEAVDVSERALAAAVRGVYGKNSFRGGLQPPEAFFLPHPEGWQVRDEVRACVRFSQGNVLDPTFLADTRFDVVLCRNLLIYLDRASRRAVLDNLRRLTAADGVVFAGHAESLELMGAGFVRAGEPGSFAFTAGKSGQAAFVEPRHRAPSATPRPFGVSPRPPTGKAAPEPGKEPRARATREAPAEKPPHSDATLDQARALADRGDLSSALEACERHLARQGATAEVYSLLGIIAQAAGDTASAQRHFDRALYLDPDHHEALIHLGLLQRQLGQTGAAEHLDRRAERSARRKAAP